MKAVRESYIRGFDRLLYVPLVFYALCVAALIGGVFLSISPKAVVKAFGETEVLHAVWLSLMPGGDSVNLDLLLPCLNTTFVAGGLEVVPVASNPVPFRVLNEDAGTIEIQVGPGEMPEWDEDDL